MRRTDLTGRDPDLGVLAARLLFGLQQEVFARLAEHGHDQVRPRHGAVLAYLEADGLRATELARLSGRPKQVIGRLVDELEALGYVERRTDPTDRRGKLVALTDRGREEQRLADEIIADIERRHARRVGKADYATFRRVLRTLTEP
ncbi:MAG TPA: MarR family transcriptional regulator [Natronosporangium sp.]